MFPSHDPSRGESYLDVTNPVEAVRRRGRPRVEEMESLQEYRAKLDRIFENTHRDQKPLLKTDKELQRERFERNRERRRDRGQILNLFKIFDKRDDLSPEIREQLLESAKSINPEIFRQIERDRGFEEDDRKMQERMEYVSQPGKDLEKRRAEYEAQYQARDDIPGTKAYKEKMEKRRAERARRDREYEKKMADLEAQRSPVPPSPKSIEPLTSGVAGLSYDELMDPDYFKKKYADPRTREEIERDREIDRNLRGKRFDRVHEKTRPESFKSIGGQIGVAGLSYDELMDPDYFKKKYADPRTREEIERDREIDRNLRGKRFDRVHEKTRPESFKSIGGQIGEALFGPQLREHETPTIFDHLTGRVPSGHYSRPDTPRLFDDIELPEKFRPEMNPHYVDISPLGEQKRILEEQARLDAAPVEPHFQAPEQTSDLAKDFAALQDLHERYKESQSGRERTSSQNTPRVQPSNPAKVKTPPAVGS